MSPRHSKTVTLREITAETVRSILTLSVSDEQKRFVADNAVSISQAYFCKQAWFRAIYAGEKPVGFVMLYIDKKKADYDVWRFMIDRRHQKRGYGTAAMQLVIEFVRSLPRAKELCLSHAPGRGNPAPFYKRFGFVHTGELNEGEKVMKLDLLAEGSLP
jgi:diamine N-acetyltransferase